MMKFSITKDPSDYFTHSETSVGEFDNAYDAAQLVSSLLHSVDESNWHQHRYVIRVVMEE